jgi:hypothetical protein
MLKMEKEIQFFPKEVYRKHPTLLTEGAMPAGSDVPSHRWLHLIPIMIETWREKYQFVGAVLLQPIPVNYAALLPGATVSFVDLSAPSAGNSKRGAPSAEKQCSKCQFSRPCKTCAKRWERKVTSYGLGVDQPLTDNSKELTNGEALNLVGDDFLHLRRTVDKGDRFMEGHEIKKIRGTNENRTFPEWTMKDKSIRKVLLLAFPKLDTNEAQRKRAGRWMRVIYFYYRLRLPRPVILKELQMTDSVFTTLLRDINRKAEKTGDD